MGATFNPFSGQMVLVPTPSTETVKPTTSFLTSDWALVGNEYVLTIPASVHNVTNPTTTVYEAVGADYHIVNVGILVRANADVVLTVSSSPDNRFVGIVVII